MDVGQSHPTSEEGKGGGGVLLFHKKKALLSPDMLEIYNIYRCEKNLKYFRYNKKYS